MDICVIGLGYIGLPTAAVFSMAGCEVHGVDTKESIVENLGKGQLHIEEPGLAAIVQKEMGHHLSVGMKPVKAKAFIISVPTPNCVDEFSSCDLSYVISACQMILPVLEEDNVVIVESTIAPRSMDDSIRPIFEKYGFTIGKNIFLAHCPERVLPGNILHELVYNNRIVGGITPRCTEEAAMIYQKIVKGRILRTEARTAELSKCMENTFRDVNIALSNELARICYELDINCLDVIALANQHPRVNLHQPGPGVGGHCLAVDPYFIYAQAPEQARMIKAARDINCLMPDFVVDKVEKLVSMIHNPKIALFGMAYKGNVDDLRESPSLKIAKKLCDKGYHIAVVDEHIQRPDFVSLDAAIKGADLIVILTDHKEYKDLDYRRIALQMRTPQLFDTRNMLHEEVANLKIINFGNVHQYKYGLEQGRLA